MTKKSKKEKLELTDEEAIGLIAESVLKNAKEIQNSLHDPFEIYSFHVQAKVFSDLDFFKEHCLEGYRSLVKINHEII